MGRFVFTYPTLSVTGESLLIADIRNGEVLGQARPTNVTTVVERTWLDRVTVRFWYETLEHTIRVPTLRLARYNAAYVDTYRFGSLDGFAPMPPRFSAPFPTRP